MLLRYNILDIKREDVESKGNNIKLLRKLTTLVLLHITAVAAAAAKTTTTSTAMT